MSLCPTLQMSDCKDESNHGQKVMQSGLPPEASKLLSHVAKRHMESQMKTREWHWVHVRTTSLVESSKAPCSDFIWGYPALVRTHKEAYCFHWLHPLMCPVSQLQVMPGCCKVPLSRKPRVSIILHVGHASFLVLIESWPSACWRSAVFVAGLAPLEKKCPTKQR